LGEAASALTALFAPGFHDSSAPVVVENAASLARGTVSVPGDEPAGLTSVKLPPM
jgi:hypothetical protein